jgi:hypothetical protein
MPGNQELPQAAVVFEVSVSAGSSQGRGQWNLAMSGGVFDDLVYELKTVWGGMPFRPATQAEFLSVG